MCYTYLIYIYSYIRHGHTCILPLGLMDGGPDSGDTVPKTTSSQIENNDFRFHAFRIFTFFSTAGALVVITV